MSIFREFGTNETSCWMERVDIFLNESLSPAVKECIQSYATASGVVDEDEEYESGLYCYITAKISEW